MAGCAVLHAVEAGNDPVAEAGCGLTVAPESVPAVADGLRRLAGEPRAERQRDGRAWTGLRAGASHLPGAGATLPAGDGSPRVNEPACRGRALRTARGRRPVQPAAARGQPLLQQRQRALLQLMARAGIQAVDGLRADRGGLRQRRQPAGAAAAGLCAGAPAGHRTAARAFRAGARAPAGGAALLQGDAVRADIAPGSQDLVLQATVFSSLLDDTFQQQAGRRHVALAEARRCGRLVRLHRR
jgi:hypothetical protein